MNRLPNRMLILVALALLPASGSPRGALPGDPPDRPPKLFKDSRQMLAIVRAQGRSEVVLLVAAKTGEAPAVAEAAQRAGGVVRYRDDDVDYLRIRLPIDRAVRFSELESVESATLDYVGSDPPRLMGPSGDMAGALAAPGEPAFPTPPPSTRGDSGARGHPTESWPPEGWGDYPLSNPYSPLADLDGAEMRERNPTFDGRGVTIGLLDGNLDLLLPEFQTAYTLDGRAVPKIADFVNTTDPVDDAEDMPQWVSMRDEVTASGKRIAYDGGTFRTPGDGAFRIGFFSERDFNDPANGAYLDQDVDRNGNPRGDDGRFALLWDERSNDVWVDTDRDRDFGDEKALTDYIDREEIGVFGKDDPETGDRESVGFTVQTDRETKHVAINLGLYQHATGIMGSVVGNREPDGRITGLAPGARLASFFYGVSNAHGLIEGLIAAAKHPEVDVIVLEQSVAIASMPYLLADGRHPISIIAERLIRKYEKLIFVPAANAPGFGIVAEDGLAPSAMSVGGYQSQTSYRRNLGFIPEGRDHMHWGGRSHGPGGDGALKPDILAASGQVSTEVGYVWRANIQEKRGLFTLPPGYAIDGGTSTATPMAAGAAALVISAAKQSGIPFGAARLKAALMGGARHLPNLAEFAQGSGLVQVGGAFDLLQELAESPPVEIVSRAPVRTRLSPLMATPNQGAGLYEREGWSVGDRGERTIAYTRRSGPAEAMTFEVRWRGNDGTFTTPPTITLPLNQPVDLPISISVKSAGAHSAIVRLLHPSVPGVAHQTLATVIAPLEFTSANGYSLTEEISVPRPDDRSIFVRVPEGASVLSVSTTSSDGTATIAAVSPGRDYLYPCGYGQAPAKPCAIANPEPGVWELNVSTFHELREFEPRRPQPMKAPLVTVKASIAGVSVAVGGGSLEGAGRNSADITLDFTNRLAALGVSGIDAELAAAFTTSRTIGQGEQHLFEVTVPEGATSLRARIDEVADEGVDLDLYLIDCSAEEAGPGPPAEERERGNKAPAKLPARCPPRAKAAAVDAGGEAEVTNPAPGRWVVVVDGYRVPSGRTSYRYMDAYTHPELGRVTIAERAERRRSGEGWSAAAHLWAAAAPPSGRALLARFIAATNDFATTSPTRVGALEVILAGWGAGGRSRSMHPVPPHHFTVPLRPLL